MSPPVFSQDDFDTTRATARSAGKLLIVDATAAWCGPCRYMDTTTWVDDAVVAWIETNAVAYQLDIEAEPDLAKDLDITSMPTIIVFRDDTEFDRAQGYRGPADLLAWMKDVAAGKREIDALRERAAELRESDEADVNVRLRLARELAGHGELDTATEQFLWLWGNMLKAEGPYVGVRFPLLLREVASLASRHEPARTALAARRDVIEAALDRGSVDQEATLEWLYLNLVLAEPMRALTWYERERERVTDQSALAVLEQQIFAQLVGAGRWAAAARALPDPERLVARWIKVLTREPDAPISPEIRAQMAAGALGEIARIYAVCLAGDREDVADRIAATTLERRSDAVTCAYLVEWALRAGVVRDFHLRWLLDAPAPREEEREKFDDLIGRARASLADG